jgi:hypothetical protein
MSRRVQYAHFPTPMTQYFKENDVDVAIALFVDAP